MLICERNSGTLTVLILRSLQLGLRKATKKENLSVMSMKRTRLDPNINRKQATAFTANQLAYTNYIMTDSVILTMINELNSN